MPVLAVRLYPVLPRERSDASRNRYGHQVSSLGPARAASSHHAVAVVESARTVGGLRMDKSLDDLINEKRGAVRRDRQTSHRATPYGAPSERLEGAVALRSSVGSQLSRLTLRSERRSRGHSIYQRILAKTYTI